jgi:hypothetical protein
MAVVMLNRFAYKITLSTYSPTYPPEALELSITPKRAKGAVVELGSLAPAKVPLLILDAFVVSLKADATKEPPAPILRVDASVPLKLKLFNIVKDLLVVPPATLNPVAFAVKDKALYVLPVKDESIRASAKVPLLILDAFVVSVKALATNEPPAPTSRVDASIPLKLKLFNIVKDLLVVPPATLNPEALAVKERALYVLPVKALAIRASATVPDVKLLALSAPKLLRLVLTLATSERLLEANK